MVAVLLTEIYRTTYGKDVKSRLVPMNRDRERESAPRRPGRPSRLSVERVVEAAIDCAHEGGLEALTMTRLASSLGVGTMTLYGYVANKRELLEMVAERLFDALEVPQSGAWQDRLADYFRQFRTTALENPVLPALLSVVPIDLPSVSNDMEELLEMMRSQGVDAERAVRGFYAVLGYTMGFVIWEIPRREHGDHAARLMHTLRTLDPQQFPLLTGPASDAVTSSVSNDQFEWGLAALLRGLEHH